LLQCNPKNTDQRGEGLMLLEHLQVIDKRFTKLVQGNTHLEKLWTGARWSEGPAWFGGGR